VVVGCCCPARVHQAPPSQPRIPGAALLLRADAGISATPVATRKNTQYATRYGIEWAAHERTRAAEREPQFGLWLREEFEDRTGEVWPLNMGQVRTTLQRLERAGLAGSDGSGEGGPRKVFRITSDGERELTARLRS
jgi:Transcriptional regulator PadR-like family